MMRVSHCGGESTDDNDRNACDLYRGRYPSKGEVHSLAWRAKCFLHNASQSRVIRMRVVISTCTKARAASFDHLVSAGEEGRRYIEAECFRRIEVNNEFKSGGLQHRHIRRLVTFEDLADVTARLLVHPRDARTIAQEATNDGKLADEINRGKRSRLANETICSR